MIDEIVLNGAKKRGFSISLILMKWKEVVGEYFYDITIPLKITFNRNSNEGTLHVGINEAYAPEINLQKEILIEKVNRIYGKKIISKLKLKNDDFFIKRENVNLKLGSFDEKKNEFEPKFNENFFEDLFDKIDNYNLKSELKNLYGNLNSNKKRIHKKDKND
tara:strand:+ start:799 stop:1284 length:486 start_codon:yes stop_codon:yes gene_type:complete